MPSTDAAWSQGATITEAFVAGAQYVLTDWLVAQGVPNVPSPWIAHPVRFRFVRNDAARQLSGERHG